MMPRRQRQRAPTADTDEVVLVDRMVAGGEGMAHLADGRVVFVPGGVAGDRVRLSSLSVHRGYARAESWTLEVPSGSRRSPPCPVAQKCGGCDWMAIPEQAQLDLAVGMVRDAFRRVGKFDPPPEIRHVHPSQPLGYRSRVRLHLGSEGTLGLLARSSSRLVAIDHCPVCTPQLNDALCVITASLGTHARQIAACIEQLEIRWLAARPELLLFQRPGSVKSALVQQWAKDRGAEFVVAWAGEAQPTSPQPVKIQIGDRAVHVLLTPGGFSQVNWQINQALVDELVQGATSRNLKSFADLYCGNGNFTLPLLARGLSGAAVEGNRSSVKCAERAAETQGLSAQFEVGAVEHVARRWAREGREFDLVVLDPPRSGARQGLSAIAELAPTWIFYCACDPVSLARDARTLCQLGYALRDVKLFDMFPQTHHVETVAWLQREKLR